MAEANNPTFLESSSNGKHQRHKARHRDKRDPVVEHFFAGVSPDVLDLTAQIVGAAIVLGSGFLWRRMAATPEAVKS